MPDDTTGDATGPENPSHADPDKADHSAEIKDAAARPADSGEDIGPSARR